MITPDTPSFDLRCEPFGVLSVEFAAEANEWTPEESKLADHIRSTWPTMWPNIRDELSAAIKRYGYDRTLDQLVQAMPYCVGVSLSPGDTSLGEDWALELVIPLASGHHLFYVGIQNDLIVSSGASF